MYWKDAQFQISDIGTGRAASAEAKIQPEDEIFLFIAPTSVEVPQLEKLCEIIRHTPCNNVNSPTRRF